LHNFDAGAPMPDFLIRPYLEKDFDPVTILWRIAREKSLPEFQRAKGHFFFEDRYYFRTSILAKNLVWVVEENEGVLAFLAMKDDFIDQLYIHPDHWRRGIGRTLLNHAHQFSPVHLWLYTLQVNSIARIFYEKMGFVAEKFGTSPPPESEPDVEYHWRAA